LQFIKFCVGMHTIFFRLSAEVNRIASPHAFAIALGIAVFTVLKVFQLSLVSVKQQKHHKSL